MVSASRRRLLLLLINGTGLPQPLKDSIGQRLMRIFAEAEKLGAPPTEAERLEVEEMFELVDNTKESK